MTERKETYRASLDVHANSVSLHPVGPDAYHHQDKLFESVKNTLLDYGCVPDPNDPTGPQGDGDQFLSGSREINWKLEDTSRGNCCDGSKPQVVCEVDEQGNITCWAECPDPANLKQKLRYRPGMKGFNG